MEVCLPSSAEPSQFVDFHILFPLLKPLTLCSIFPHCSSYFFLPILLTKCCNQENAATTQTLIYLHICILPKCSGFIPVTMNELPTLLAKAKAKNATTSARDTILTPLHEYSIPQHFLSININFPFCRIVS